MITGAHSIIYSKHPDKDRAFLRDGPALTSVDAGLGVYQPKHPRPEPMK
jgi:hypothetical protein